MNNYMFIRVVGKGSYGEVNLVKHKTDRKQYVIKKLNLTTSSKRERRAAEQEAQLLSRLRHPNIVTYRESWEGEDCQLYIAMGFCEGGDLYHRLKQQKGELLPERQVVEWFVQIAMALQYLHEEHILHRDLKTQNIFLTKTNIIKVGDLGIARVLENQNDMASTLIGTPYYMSPELFSNKPYNHKSDVWALGCCVYEMSTLKHAFNAKDMNSLVYRIVEGKLPQMPSKYDPQLGALIKSMLCKRPEDRPDVKLILRQPYIKRQIAMFLEATKEKTAKSRKKAVGGSRRPNSAASVVSSQPWPERPPQCPQPDPNTRGKRKEEINTQEHKGRNGITQDTPPQTHLTTKSPTQDILNTTGVSLATISKIDIDLQTQEETNTQRGDPPQTVSNARADNDTLCQSSVEEQMGGNPDPPPCLIRAGCYQVSVPGKGRARPPMDVMQGAPKTRDRVRTSVEKTVNTDDKDDTMELLKDVVIESPATGHSICLGVSTSLSELRSAGQLKVESTGQMFEVNIENKDDTRNLLKEVPAHKHTAVVKESLVSTEKLLEPLPPVAPCHLEPLPPVPEQDTPPLCTPSSSEPSVSCQRRQRDRGRIQSDQDKWNKVAAPRPLPPPPINALVVEVKKRSRTNTDKKRATTTTSVTTISSSKDGNTPLPQQERPLTARERRRLRQSQQNPSQPIVNAERRASYDVASLHNKQPESQNSTVTRSVSEMGKETNQQDRFLGRPSDEDECSSSTSSTDHSEGDCKEGKSESSDMQDLVQMMTQTLRMDGRDTVSELDGVRSTPLAEFKLNRKYRDTLMLHGKAREEQEFHFSELSTGTTSGPAKIRRAIEHLKTDVVKGLGVKLLDRVLDIMEDDDEDKRELCLRKHMGDDKYQSYALMVRQLKFFEDVSFKG
ncbi:LOW QUALITY PROTEIN: serine/threonine-protein kinase Nek4 [Oncorhynchus tshawytscha]|uniref:LOW QUALITY PROTEIN: serine/threonine-protein kinase Nek4 n=1 Tax=Oncorhynchus tshawytscha TaxID=74940 RepID=UPI001C3C8D4F|nr:LOW QUALITY PROTEIN: serine/threonine-protein kinase Nek4 [Oncorhynchus tshawytscha]